MVRRRMWIAGLALAVLGGLGSTLDLNLGSRAPQAPEAVVKADPVSEMQGAKVKALYENWARTQESAGGETNLVVALGRSRTHAVAGQRMAGAARIDMKSGSVTAEVSGLPADKAFDLWFVDNAAADQGSALPESDDRMVRVGELARDGDKAKLDGSVDVSLFDRFQIDMVVVAPKGEAPATSGVLFGSLSLFQRLYSALGSEARLMASDFSQGVQRSKPQTDAPLLSVRSAYAAETIFVDADVIFRQLVRTGADLFINGTFSGNGRTCATCHPSLNNVTIDVPFIASLSDDNPLFAAEFIPALATNFENPTLMRGAALILENLDGFNPPTRFVMRSVPHTLALATSLAPTNIPFDNTAPPNSNFPAGFPAQRTGWGGDGSPNSGSLRDFAIGAVTQHFTLTMQRRAGTDFRLPTVAELDAMEAFQLALGRQAEVNIATLRFRDARVRLGRDLFTRLDTGNPPKPQIGPQPNPAPQGPPLPAGKCALCHNNAGATLNTVAFTQLFNNLGIPVPTVTGNANFATGVNDLASPPAAVLDPTRNPRDGGFGLIPHDGSTRLPQIGNVPCANPRGGFGVVTLPGGVLPPGLCEEDFNTPPIIEAADTPPFFHNNAVNTIEAAVSFYNDAALNNSVGGQLLRLVDTNGIGIKLDSTQVTAIASLLRVLNALENIRQARETVTGVINGAASISLDQAEDLLDHVNAETEDALKVLEDGQIHPRAIQRLRSAASNSRRFDRILFVFTILNQLNQARADLVDP
jgi:hypothetical protein